MFRDDRLGCADYAPAVPERCSLDEVGKTDPQEAERLADWVASWLTGEFGAVHVRAGDRM